MSELEKRIAQLEINVKRATAELAEARLELSTGRPLKPYAPGAFASIARRVNEAAWQRNFNQAAIRGIEAGFAMPRGSLALVPERASRVEETAFLGELLAQSAGVRGTRERILRRLSDLW